MKRPSIPPTAILALWLGVAVLLPGVLALFGACGAAAVAPTLAFTEAAGAFSVLAVQSDDRRIIQVEALVPDGMAAPQAWAVLVPLDGSLVPTDDAPPSPPPGRHPLRV